MRSNRNGLKETTTSYGNWKKAKFRKYKKLSKTTIMINTLLGLRAVTPKNRTLVKQNQFKCYLDKLSSERHS